MSPLHVRLTGWGVKPAGGHRGHPKCRMLPRPLLRSGPHRPDGGTVLQHPHSVGTLANTPPSQSPPGSLLRAWQLSGVGGTEAPSGLGLARLPSYPTGSWTAWLRAGHLQQGNAALGTARQQSMGDGSARHRGAPPCPEAREPPRGYECPRGERGASWSPEALPVRVSAPERCRHLPPGTQGLSGRARN